MEEGRVKGLAFRTVMKVLGELTGPDGVRACYEEMSSTVREELESGRILASGWYPVSWYREMLRAIFTVHKRLTPRELGRLTIRSDLNGVHRFMMRLFTPQTIISQTPKLFPKYYTGTLTTEEGRKGFVRAKYRNCQGFDRNMWQEIVGASEETLEIAGARHLRVRISSGGEDGDAECDLEIYWT